MVEKGTFKPTRFEKEYKGLESIPEALSDIASRKVWGKAVIRVDTGSQNEQNVAAKL
jgi:NADPH2:quinone reductase